MPRSLSIPVLRFFRLPVCFVAFFTFFTFFTGAPADAATVRGTITDPDGRAASGARVMLAGPVGRVDIARTAADGAFTFTSIAAGRYEIRVALEGFRAEPVSLVLSKDDDRAVQIELSIAAIAEEVVVSAAQVDTPLSRTPDSVTVLSAADLRARQIDDLPGALRLVPGVTMTQNGGRGTLASLFPRGGESDFTLVLIDGIRVNAFGGGFDFGQVPIANVERIEVVRGPQSALYGSDAIGAVVQIVTRRGGTPFIEGLVEQGSFDTRRFAVTSAGGAGDWEWGASAERLTSDGLTGRQNARAETIGNDDYSTRQMTLAGGWRPASRTFIRGEARFGANDRGFPGPFGADPGGTFSGVDLISRGTNDNRLFSIAATHAWNARLAQRAEVTYADLEGTFVSPFGRSESDTQRWSGRVQTDLSVAAGLGVSLGVEAQRERAGSTFITGEQFEPIPVRRRVVGYFAEARFESAQRLFLTGGFRLEQISRDALAGNPDPFGARPAFARDSVLSSNPKVAVTYFVQPAERRQRGWTRLHGSAGTGIRPPDAFEIAFTDNPSLAPERSRSFDAGVEQALAGGAVVLDATAFSNTYDDLIVAVGRSVRDASRYRTDNISNARARGLELSAAARTRWGLDGRVSYTWMATEILDLDHARGVAPAPFTVGDRLIRRPRHQAFVDVAFTRGPITAYTQIGARGGTLDVDPSFGAFGGLFEAPGFVVTHAGASFRIRRGFEAFARVMNLFDRSYEEALGFPALGRSAHVGIRLAAGR